MNKFYKTRGSRFGILIVGDSLPSNKFTLKNINHVLDPIHPVYNSLIIPIKLYLNNYLNYHGYKLPLEEKNKDYFYYINAIQDPSTKSNPDLTDLSKEVNRPEHKIILSMGNFTFWAVESVLGNKVKKNLSIKELGEIFYSRVDADKIEYPLNLPILHNIANLKFEETNKFITDTPNIYISYFHYVGVKLGKLFLQNKDKFEFIIPIQ